MKKVYYITKRNTATNLDSSISLLELLEIKQLQDKQLFLKSQQCNCLIFTSKNAIFALEENAGQKWHKIPCYVIGKGSNQTLEHFGVKAKFIGTQSYGNSFAMELQHQLKGKKPLFIRAKKIASSLVEILGDDKTKKTLVIGLGNWNITSDALGPKSVSKTLVTRHIFKNYNKDYDDDFTEVSALSPGVMGITGLETSETVKSIVDMIKPDRVIAIDALASRKMERVNSTIQISTAGISPGGGVGNKRKALNKSEKEIKQ